MAVSMCSVTSPSSAISGTDMYLKRPLQSDMEEAEFEPALKMKCPPSGSVGGGGRRKQSKPIRVRSDVDSGPVEDLVVDMKISATQSDSPAPETCREGPPVDTVDMDDQKPALDQADVFPTKYHQLGSELKQEVGLVSYEDREGSDVDGKDVAQRSDMVDDLSLNELKRNARHDADAKSWNQFPNSFYASSLGIPLPEQSFMTKSDCLPTNLSMRPTSLHESLGNADVYSTQTSARPDVDVYRADMQETERFWEGSDGGNGAEKSRIFHPDAYCDICDREFCNKYFLKTHRANKHGIYDGASTDVGAYSSSAAVPPSMSGLVFSQAVPPGLDPPPTSMTDMERATSSSVSCSSNSSLSGVLPIPQLPSNIGILPYNDPLPPPPRSTDMEDYCDICQKHFCNKYYLRKHRQDVHGLSPVDVVARRSQADFTRGSASSDVAESSSTPHFPLRVSSSASSSTLPPPSALSNFPMFLPPPFGAPLPVVPPFLPGAAGLGFGSLPFGVEAGGASSKLSASSTSQAQPQQQLVGGTSSLLPGMLSPDAYMDLFRKEILGGYLMNNGDQRDVTAAIAAVAAAAANGSDPLPPRLPISEPSAPDTPANSTPDTFAEMLQRIGARIGKKNDVGVLHHDLFRLNGLGGGHGAVRLPGSLTSTPSSSSSSASSRLVDRVVCDLCNKEVCNKYFLKTHKMKVHGWDPNTSTIPTSTAAPLISAESTSLIKSEPLPTASQPPPPPPPHIYLPSLPTSQVDKPLPFFPLDPLTPKDAELQKMGMDPEAYCEICRKEFCSKYFLRTHRQNIHGIQDNNNASSSSSPAVAGPSVAPSFVPTTPQPFSSVVLPPPAPPLASLSSSLSSNCSSSYLFGAAGGSSVPAADGSMAEQRSWKWKEPVNATRVSCTLCNKVLCNKYFLRTHMAKRHGVTAVDTVQTPTLSPSVIQTQPLQSHLSTNGVHQGSVDTASVDERKEEECFTDSGKAAAVSLMMSGRTSADVQTVTARTWQVPANDGTPSAHCDGTYSVVKCPLCTLALSDRDALLRHLTTVHHVDDQMSTSLISAVAQSGSDSSSSPDALVPSRAPAIGGSGGLVRRRRQFRCSFCRERFRTRVHCELHARAAHPRTSGSCVEVTPAVDVVETQASAPPAPPKSQSNSLPAVYATPLDPGDSNRSQMLPFVLRELPIDDTEPRFSTALVYLPTFRPLTSPTNVTFTLTPVVQPLP